MQLSKSGLLLMQTKRNIATQAPNAQISFINLGFRMTRSQFYVFCRDMSFNCTYLRFNDVDTKHVYRFLLS